MVSIRTRATSLDPNDHPEWLHVIWAAKDIFGDEAFDGPLKIEAWWAGGTVEEYIHERVIHRGDGSVSVCAKTEQGEKHLRAAADRLGIYIA